MIKLAQKEAQRFLADMEIKLEELGNVIYSHIGEKDKEQVVNFVGLWKYWYERKMNF